MYRAFLPVLAVVLAGCSKGGQLPMATSADKARPALESVLGAWKAGKTADDLKAGTPATYLHDGDFIGGGKLLSFKIEDEGKPYGTGYRYDVTITVERAGKTSAPKKVAYRVVTEPTPSVSREDD